MIESAFGPVFAIAGAGLILLVVAAFLWDVVAAAVHRVRDRFGGAEAAEPIREHESTNTRRTAESRDRRAARAAARRSAIHAKHAPTVDVDG
ncbi:hypothetical protein ACGFIX_02025 [Nocardia salmonicida]|uniref:hypothetical protein n=1 Tax=Nocardia salmonicida TaxID=53431 RepID=UPI00371F91F5